MTLVGVAVGAAAAGGDRGASCIWVVCWALIPARCARVGVINVTTMSVAVVPILPTLVGSGRARGLLCAGAVATKPEAGCCGKLPPPLPPPALPLLWPPPLRLSRQLLGGGCWPTAMQNCWMFVNCRCIAAMVVAWVFIDSCVVAYAAPKFASDSL